jgi:hypothetical protein
LAFDIEFDVDYILKKRDRKKPALQYLFPEEIFAIEKKPSACHFHNLNSI